MSSTPKAEQTIDDLAPRITQARRDLMDAIEAGAVNWHYPRTAASSHSTAREGRRTRVVTGEVNWLRSHGLATLALPASTKAEQRRVILTPKGHDLLALLVANVKTP
jgi:hypothetical protein